MDMERRCTIKTPAGWEAGWVVRISLLHRQGLFLSFFFFFFFLLGGGGAGGGGGSGEGKGKSG